ncbi:hypothetical protein K438DRAFT_1816147 [Mycena galopus ATCC 62051]|nr:hypothetical protein K438DRAFT_1816147 [Mycena galopus ATCC 62051]
MTGNFLIHYDPRNRWRDSPSVRCISARLEKQCSPLGYPAQGARAFHHGTTCSYFRTPSVETPSGDEKSYDAGFMSQGNDYVTRHPHARADLQIAEQAWHDWVVGYQPRPRPGWALQPLPGLHMVRIAGPARHVPLPTTPARRVAIPVPIAAAHVLILAPPHVTLPVPIAAPRIAVQKPTRPRRFPIPLPTPPPSSPVSEAAPPCVTLPVPVAVPCIAVQTPTRPRRFQIPLPTPLPSSPVSEAGSSSLNPIAVSDGDDSDEDCDDEYFDEDTCLPFKRNFLVTIEISDEEVYEIPRLVKIWQRKDLTASKVGWTLTCLYLVVMKIQRRKDLAASKARYTPMCLSVSVGNLERSSCTT